MLVVTGSDFLVVARLVVVVAMLVAWLIMLVVNLYDWKWLLSCC